MTLRLAVMMRYKVLWAMTPVPAARHGGLGRRSECAADGQQRRLENSSNTISDALENITLNLNMSPRATRR